MQPRELVVGTRPSALALWQARWVADQLEAAARRHGLPLRLKLKEIRTEGDLDHTTPLAAFGQRGIFVRAVEQALLRGEADVAVHSLKDLPGEQPPGLVLAAFPVRDDPRDAAVLARPPVDAASPAPLGYLPQGARLGTGSPRRIAHLRHWRPDLEFVPIRGNVDTRLRKLEEMGLDAVVLAAAGLRRLGLWDERMQVLDPSVCLPAPGQGALALEVRADDEMARRAVQLIDDISVRLAVTAERELLARLGGGCHVPIGALATWTGGDGEKRLRLMASVADPAGSRLVVAEETRVFDEAALTAGEAAVADAEAAARALAHDTAAALLAKGAGELLGARGA